MTQDYKENLRKDIGIFTAIALVVGTVIGSGIFFKPGVIVSHVESPWLSLAAWILGGVITVFSGLTVAELAAAIPKTGGLYIYLAEIYGEKIAFLFGWVQTVIYGPAILAALAIIFITQATYFVEMSVATQKIVAILIVVFLSVLNSFGAKYGGRIQNIFTAGKLIPIAAIIGFGLFNGSNANFSLPLSEANAGGLGAAILATFWAYDGWLMVSYVAGEIKNPQKVLPQAIVIGLFIIMFVYVSMNIAVLNVMPINDLAKSQTPGSDVAQLLFGTSGGALVAAGILISIFGTLNGFLLTGARVPFAMAERGEFIRADVFGKVHPRFQTPVNAIVLQLIITAVYILTGSFNQLSDLAMFVIWLFFILALIGVFIHRKKFPDIVRPYKTPGYPFIPIIGGLGALYVILNTLFTNTMNAILGITITLLGLPVYYYIRKRRNSYAQGRS